VEDALSFRGNIQLAKEALNVLQSELDPETLRAVKPGKRILICGRASPFDRLRAGPFDRLRASSGLSRVHWVAEK
jgi:hypothetical protein